MHWENKIYIDKGEMLPYAMKIASVFERSGEEDYTIEKTYSEKRE